MTKYLDARRSPLAPLPHNHSRGWRARGGRGGRFGRTVTALAAVAGMALGTVALAALPAAAVEITTDYPVVEVQAGQDVSLDLNIAAASTERVDLTIASAPDGWHTFLQGGGFTIGGVYVGPDQTPRVTLHVQVPPDAATGEYHVMVTADGPSGSKTLDAEIDVVAHASDAYTLTAEFAKLQGSTTDTFSYSLKLANNTGADASFGLTARGPQGWTVTAAPASQDKASAVDVKAGGTATVSVTAKPPANVTAGTYDIAVSAQGQGVELHTKLSVEVVGSPSLSIQTANQVLAASGSAGATTDLHLVVTNTGSAPLTDVKLASAPPSDWTVTFEPKTIDAIAPGQTANVLAHITPAGDAITGDYQVTLRANSAADNGNIDIRYTVQTSSWWGLVGIIVIVVAVVVLLWLFRRYGRR